VLVRPAVVEIPKRAVYPHSVIRGGVRDGRELQLALTADHVVARHYTDFNVRRAEAVQVERDRKAYVSYRVGDRVYWTRQKLTLRKGEGLLTDGTNCVRARCGNRISDTPRLPVSEAEPRDVASDIPELLPPPELAADYRLGARGLPLTPMLAPEIFPGMAPARKPAAEEREARAIFAYLPPWASAGAAWPMPVAPAGGGVIDQFELPIPLPPPVLTGQAWASQPPRDLPARAAALLETATIVQLLRPPLHDRTSPKSTAGPGGSSTPGETGNPPGGSNPPGGGPGIGGPGTGRPGTEGPGAPGTSSSIESPVDLPSLTPSTIDQTVPAPVPEPATAFSVLAALALFACRRIVRRRQA
jgi:hypothetical protein